MNLRQNFFWFLDKVKGQPLKQLYAKTHNILEAKDSKYAEAENAKQLQKLIDHTTKTTTFYSNKKYEVLQDFPVVNKNIIRDNYDDFFSSKYKKEECKLVFTSGSTGAPFRLYQNKGKIQKINADNIYFSSKSNYHIGEPLVFIRAWVYKIDFKIKFDYFKKNIYTYSTFDLVDEGLPKIINTLNKKKKTLSFMIYGSTLENICRYIDTLDKNPIQFKTKSIITISDALSVYAKKAASDYFGVVPLSRYSNTESGIIAQQISDSDDRFRINNSSFIIEVLELNENRAVPNGTPGRIVVTDLYNFATPLIRYDTGDIGIKETDEDGIPYFTEISGRKVDQLYNTEGKLLPSLFMTHLLMEFGEFKQFQIIQKSKLEYHININTNMPFDEESIIEKYKEYLGTDALVKVNHVDDIPLLSSGKRRQVVNEYYN